jgi:CDP-glucose 4,6-dehydratase
LQLLDAKVKGYALAFVPDNELYSLLKGDEICDSVIIDPPSEASLKREISQI